MRSSESCEGELRRGHEGCDVVLTQTTLYSTGWGNRFILKLTTFNLYLLHGHRTCLSSP